MSPGSIIELERFSDRRGSVKAEDANSVSSMRSARPSAIVVVDEAMQQESGTSTIDHFDVEVEGSGDHGLDGEVPQRNVSSLAPTDGGFHAWAFVSFSLSLSYFHSQRTPAFSSILR